MCRRWFGAVLLGALVIGSTPSPRTSAEDRRDDKLPDPKPAKLPADLDFVYESGNSFVAVRPNEVLDASPVKQLPERARKEFDRMIADAPRSVGVAVTDMERVIFLLPTTPRSEPVAVIRTLRAYDREAVQAAVAGPEGKAEKYKGYTLHEAKDRHGMCLCAIDGQTFAVGRSRGVKDVLDRVDGRSTPRPHGTALEWAAEKHQITLGMAPEAFVGLWLFEGRAEVKTVGKAAASSSAESRPATIQEKTRPPERFEKQRPPENKKPNPPDSIKEKQGRGPGSAETFVSYQPPDRFEDRREEPDFGEILANLPVQALPYKPLLSARSLAATIDLGAESKARWRITFEDEDAAKDGEASVRIALYVLREALGRLPRELHVSGELAPKLTAAVRGVQTALRAAPLQQRGATVEGSLTLATDEAALKPLFAEIEKVANRTDGENRLKQVGIAMLSYQDATGAYPNAAIIDQKGKPMLSWRVAILPYIEQQNLYQQFKFDEPWDSPNNIRLLDKMPAVYALPNRPAKGKGETFFRVFTGPRTPFDLSRNRPGPLSAGLPIVQFTDGTSNTLLVVEAGESVPWTKPDELPFPEKGPLPKLGAATSNRFFALFADGSVRQLPIRLDEQTLRNLVDPADGNVIDWEKIEGTKRQGRAPAEARPEGGTAKPSTGGPAKSPPPPPERKP